MAQVIGMVVFYPMVFLSGAAMPIEILPGSLRRVSGYLPITYAVRLLRGVWFGEPWRDPWLEVVVLGGVMLVAAALAARCFRWE